MKRNYVFVYYSASRIDRDKISVSKSMCFWMKNPMMTLKNPYDSWVNIGEYKLPINRGELRLPDHLSFHQQQERIERSNCDEIDTTRPMTLYCMDCGILFASAKDLQHAKRGCPDVHARDMDHLTKRCKYENNSDTNYDSEEERRAKSRRWIALECDGSNQSSSDESDIDEDEKDFEELIQKAYDKYSDLYHEKKK